MTANDSMGKKSSFSHKSNSVDAMHCVIISCRKIL